MKRLTIHCDGSCYYKDGRMGLGIAWFEGDEEIPFYTQSINKHERLGTSNEAEYLAIINALHSLRRPALDWENIIIYSDSEIVIKQILGLYEVRGENLKNLWLDVQRLLKHLPQIEFKWCPRSLPRQQIVDRLSKKGNNYFIEKTKNERVKRRTA